MNNYNIQQTWSPNTADVLGDRRPSLKDLQNNMNHALMVNSESNNYIETESHKIRRHSGGPWTLSK